MFEQINEVLQVGSVILLLVTGLLLLVHSKQGKHLWLGICFGLSIVCYLIVGSEAARQSRLLRLLLLTGAFTNPVFFWFLAKAIFDDHFKPSLAIVGWLVLIIATHANFYFSNPPTSLELLVDGFVIAGQITSIGFVVAAFYTAIKTKQDDLIDSRLHFRNVFVVVTAVLTIVSIVMEVIPVTPLTEIYFKISQRICILGITTWFLANNFSIRPGIFFLGNSKPKPSDNEDPQLKSSLVTLLNDQKIYRKEGLTIRRLAELMNVQEYRLRKLINGQLGFKNFNDFLNQYRIDEASSILADPTQSEKTVQEISYQLGYQSIGPFYKAFKEMKGITPTSFRKVHLS